MQGQLDQILQVLQSNSTSSIFSNIEPNLKGEGKEHGKAITLRSGVVIKESIRPTSGEEVRKKDRNTRTPSVGDVRNNSV